MPQSPDMASAFLQEQLFILPELKDCWEGKEMPTSGQSAWNLKIISNNLKLCLPDP